MPNYETQYLLIEYVKTLIYDGRKFLHFVEFLTEITNCELMREVCRIIREWNIFIWVREQILVKNMPNDRRVGAGFIKINKLNEAK